MKIYHRDEFPHLIRLASLALYSPIQTADCEKSEHRMNSSDSPKINRVNSLTQHKLFSIQLGELTAADALDA